jgi:hypothetical protein
LGFLFVWEDGKATWASWKHHFTRDHLVKIWHIQWQKLNLNLIKIQRSHCSTYKELGANSKWWDGAQTENPECGKCYRTQNPVSSANKLQGEIKERGWWTLIRFMWSISWMNIIYAPCLDIHSSNSTVKEIWGSGKFLILCTWYERIAHLKKYIEVTL